MYSFFAEIDAKAPLIQAPMAGAQDEELAISVARSGGVGSIPCALLRPEDVLTAIARFRSATDGPLNLNFFCHSPTLPDPKREAQWLEELRPYYNALAVEPPKLTAEARHPLDADMVDAVCAIKPEVVSFHFGLPAIPFLDRIRASGAKIIATATTVDEATFLNDAGCDAIIAQSVEAGGHQGAFLPAPAPDRLPTHELVRRISSIVSTIPVIAAGGIADVSTVRAAMAAGASGVQVGTRFLKAPEATITARHRSILTGEEDRETAITNVFTGRPARGFVNRLVREVGPMNSKAPPFPRAISALKPLRAATPGQEDFVAMWAGENWKSGAAKPAADIVRELAQGFEPSAK